MRARRLLPSVFGGLVLALVFGPLPAHAQADAAAVVLAPDDVHGKAGIKCEGCHSKPGPDQFAHVPATDVAALCGQCHVREADFYDKSPKRPVFAAIGLPACVTCHTNHSIVRPIDAWIGFKEPAVCMKCHIEGSKGDTTIHGLQDGLGQISRAVEEADAILGRAEVAGMLVDEGRAKLRSAHEQQILARVAVHAFRPSPLAEIVTGAVAGAAQAEAVGNQALADLRFRRQGLAVATLLILGFLITLGIKIRRLPPVGD